MNHVLFSSQKQDWETPDHIYNKLNEEFNFDFDPCPVNPEFDGLSIEWGKCNFVNPPYNKLKEWIKKAFQEYNKGKTVVLLIPARTDTKAFHDYLYNRAEIRFIKGIIKFKGAVYNAPFPSMICILK